MKKIIYFDNAATTALHTDVLTSMTPYFCDEFPTLPERIRVPGSQKTL